MVRTATLGLARRVTREDLNTNNASLNIKCVASIYTAYYKTVELVASLKVRKKTKRRRENYGRFYIKKALLLENHFLRVAA